MPDEPDPLSEEELVELAGRMLSPSGMYFILVGREVISLDNVLEWGQWLHNHIDDRIIGRSHVTSPGGRVFTVSTVFLGLDHSFGEGPPLLFETMIFDRDHHERQLERLRDGEPLGRESRWGDFQWRYATIEEAEAGHLAAVEAVYTGKEPEEE